MRYGIPSELWMQAKEEALKLIRDAARRRSTVTYTEVSQAITSAQIGPHDYAMAALLGEIASEEDDLGRGLITALVVDKAESQPGVGFFNLAKGRGYNVSDKDEFWIEQMNRVYDSYSFPR